MSGEFAGVRALVTGGASGIGLAAADELARRGASVAVLDREAPPDACPHHVVHADVADDASVRTAVAAAVDQLGGLDVLVNCAAIGAMGTVADGTDAEWTRALDINVLGVVRVSRAALPALRASERAAIVNVTSIAALVGVEQRALYSATKGAVHSLTLAMAADHLGEGIRVNAISPGTSDTPWIGRLLARADDPAAARAALVARQPHGRLVLAEEVADGIAYLASPRSGSTTGTILHVDGGFQLLRRTPRP